MLAVIPLLWESLNTAVALRSLSEAAHSALRNMIRAASWTAVEIGPALGIALVIPACSTTAIDIRRARQWTRRP
jgi:hypothetical protein